MFASWVGVTAGRLYPIRLFPCQRNTLKSRCSTPIEADTARGS
jgi:hypothetical protein